MGHEEVVVAETTFEEVEEEVMREVRSLISNPPPEGWLNYETHMVYNTNEPVWGSESITNEEMEVIKRHHASPVPTNANCINSYMIMKKWMIREYLIIYIIGVANVQRRWRKCIADGHFGYDEELILQDPQSTSMVSGSPSFTFQTQKIQSGHGRRE